MNQAALYIVAIDIRSAHNIGALFRTADGLGAEIVLVGICPRPIGALEDDRLPHIAQNAHRMIAKTALGAESTVPWHYFETPDKAFTYLRAQDASIYAIEQDAHSHDIRTIDASRSLALVLGTEVEGLSKEILAQVDAVYEIPMVGLKESFNVSIAAAIALYQVQSSRNFQQIAL